MSLRCSLRYAWARFRYRRHVINISRPQSAANGPQNDLPTLTGREEGQ